jgi:hypothetical protein
MSSVSKERIDSLKKTLLKRVDNLMYIIDGRPLKNSNEGAGKGQWAYPEKMTWIEKTDDSIAITDIKTVLSEISKIL